MLPRPQPSAFDVFPPTHCGLFNVSVDHFRFSQPAERFGLRYFAYNRFAAHKDAPVLFFFGGEASLEDFYNASGGIFEMARNLSASVFMPEHRFYGESLPFGRNGSFTPKGLVYLTIEQALADAAELLAALPSLLGCGHASATLSKPLRCRVILLGGSYGGMLAAWHRYKYPHLSLGAIASGAPVDFYPGDGVQDAFLDATLETFRQYGCVTGCDRALLSALKSAASATPAELRAAGVRSCAPLVDADVARFSFYARGAVATVACLDYPYPCSFVGSLPANPVAHVCKLLVGTHTAPLRSLLSGVLLYVNASGELPCLDLRSELVGEELMLMSSEEHHGRLSTRPSRLPARPSRLPARPAPGRLRSGGASTDLGVRSWNYQACTELPLEPITSDGFGFYPPSDGAQLGELERHCAARFGVEARPEWLPTTFGVGADLAEHGSNILFVENDKDPWHVGTRTLPATGGVRGSVRRAVFRGGAHHQEFRFASPYDSAGVIAARELELRTVQNWLAENSM